jgi:hypothetical protein
MTTERKAAFLAGEGTITLQEAREWSDALCPRTWYPPPSGMALTEPLMTSCVDPLNQLLDECDALHRENARLHAQIQRWGDMLEGIQ